MKQYAALNDTVYFWFAANDTSGSGGDGASPAADVRLAGAAAAAAPVYSPTPVLLSHANYPAGAYEVAIAATAGNGFAANNTYAVFCTLAIDAQNPTGFVGSFDLKPVEANVIQLLDTAWLTPGVAGTPDVNTKLLGGTAQTGNDVGADVNDILTDTAEIGVAGAGLTGLGGMSAGMMAEIESECNDALVALKLDHLIAVADVDEPVNDSIIAKLAATTGDWSNFAKASDSLQSIRDVAPHGSAMVGTSNAALAATALSTVQWTNIRAGYLDNINNVNLATIADISTLTAVEIAHLDADISSRSSHTVANVRESVCLVGDPASSIGKILYEVYINRLTAARAGYLDNINNANLATIVDISTFTAAKIAHLDADISTRSSHTANNVRDAILDDATRFSGADIAAILTDTGVIGIAGAGLTDLGGMSVGMKAEVESECNDALVGLDLDHWIEVTAGAEEPTDGSYLDQIMHKDAGQTFDSAFDSLEAIRDRGDIAWITGGAGGITDILNVQPLIPNSIDLANTVSVRIGLGLTNMIDDLPTPAEITPGTIKIERKAYGGTAWSTIVNDAACSEVSGLIYYDEVFDSGSNYAEGDTIKITFKNQKITVAANDYDITAADGWVFFTYIREQPVLDYIKRALGLTQENHYIDNTTFSTGKLTSARIRIYSVAGSVGTAADVIATYTVTVTYDALGNMDTYKVVKI